MNPRVAHIGMVIVGIDILAFLAFLALTGGCRPALPAEPPYVETVRDAAHLH